jgi:hypothetical protein
MGETPKRQRTTLDMNCSCFTLLLAGLFFKVATKLIQWNKDNERRKILFFQVMRSVYLEKKFIVLLEKNFE